MARQISKALNATFRMRRSCAMTPRIASIHRNGVLALRELFRGKFDADRAATLQQHRMYPRFLFIHHGLCSPCKCYTVMFLLLSRNI